MAAPAIEWVQLAHEDEVAHPAPRHRRRRTRTLLASGAVAALLVLGGHGEVRFDSSATTSRAWDASSQRLTAAADAYFAEQAAVARGRAADSARLEAAADAAP